MVMNYSEVEAKVREATNDDPWGAPSTLMQELAKFTFTYEHYPEVMSMLWKRMFESKKNWRRTYKVRIYDVDRSTPCVWRDTIQCSFSHEHFIRMAPVWHHSCAETDYSAKH